MIRGKKLGNSFSVCFNSLIMGKLAKLSGIFMLADLASLPSSSLDAKLAPEHLLHLCFEHETKFCSSNKSTLGYNFYKVLIVNILLSLKCFCFFPLLLVHLIH